jgi:hypothetical protein
VVKMEARIIFMRARVRRATAAETRIPHAERNQNGKTPRSSQLDSAQT